MFNTSLLLKPAPNCMCLTREHRDSKQTDPGTALPGRLQLAPTVVFTDRLTSVLAFRHELRLMTASCHFAPCICSCVRILLLEKSPITQACRVPGRGFSGMCLISEGLRLSVSICSCCVFWPFDPPGLPHLRIVASAEWSVPCASGSVVSHQSQLPGMATSPMQLQLLRHVGPRLQGRLLHAGIEYTVMARVRSTNSIDRLGTIIASLQVFSEPPCLGQPEVDWTEHSDFARCVLQAACQGATALIPDFFTCLTMPHHLFAVIG